MRQKQKDQNSESPTFTNTNTPMEQLKESIIGPSIRVKGELTGEENLTVQGQVEGQIDLKQSHVTIGRTGCINADVYGKITTIEGEVQGNLFGEEKIVLRQSAVVRGDMRAPRINLEEGAKFKGNIDMDFKDGEKQPTLKEVPFAAMGGRLGQRVSKSPAGRSPVPPLLDLPAS